MSDRALNTAEARRELARTGVLRDTTIILTDHLDRSDDVLIESCRFLVYREPPFSVKDGTYTLTDDAWCLAWGRWLLGDTPHNVVIRDTTFDGRDRVREATGWVETI